VATHEITKVRTERPAGYQHEHIAAVELDRDPFSRIPRATVIRNLRSPWGDRYFTYGAGRFARVIAVGCHICGFGDYITTEPDTTTDNNLLSLPRF
jgi:hypothetical protein